MSYEIKRAMIISINNSLQLRDTQRYLEINQMKIAGRYLFHRNICVTFQLLSFYFPCLESAFLSKDPEAPRTQLSYPPRYLTFHTLQEPITNSQSSISGDLLNPQSSTLLLDGLPLFKRPLFQIHYNDNLALPTSS